MRKILYAVTLLGFGLAGCETTPDPTIIRELDPCPATATAAVEPRPERPALTAEQQSALDRAVILALGEPLAIAVIGFTDVLLPAYTNRQVERIEQTRGWCAGRVTAPPE